MNTTPDPDKTSPALRKANFLNPALLLFLVLLPLVLAVFVAVIRPSAEEMPRPAVVQAVPSSAPVAEAPGVVEDHDASPGDAAGSGDTEVASGQGRGGAVVCGFQELVGQKADPGIIEKLKATGNPYRLLGPGSMITMDFNASRINLDVDDKSVIRRVWCG